MLKESVEPKVQKALQEYKLNGFKFDRMILGSIVSANIVVLSNMYLVKWILLTQPPRIGGIKVYDKNIARNEIIMDLDLFYAGDCDINFSLGGVRGGIKDFQIVSDTSMQM